MDLKALQISAMHRNGINISRLRKNGQFKVETIDDSVFRLKIYLKEYDNISAANYKHRLIFNQLAYSPLQNI